MSENKRILTDEFIQIVKNYINSLNRVDSKEIMDNINRYISLDIKKKYLKDIIEDISPEIDELQEIILEDFEYIMNTTNNKIQNDVLRKESIKEIIIEIFGDSIIENNSINQIDKELLYDFLE